MNDNEAEPKKRPGERNLGASLQQRLRNHVKATGADASLILLRYINERFLYRLSVSPYRTQFVLRGATLFALWNDEPHRATRDIDLLASGDSSTEALRRILSDVCQQSVAADGVEFRTETIHIEERTEGRIYQGAHIEIGATLGTARPRLEIDIAFGEATIPPPAEAELPSLLGMPAPRLLTYQRETAIAEKCQALVSLGIANTRMKDFYDLWYLSQAFPFDGERLSSALRATFTRRNTPFPEDGLPVALTQEFIRDTLKRRQWNAFVGKSNLTKNAAGLPELMEGVRAFLQPPLAALAKGEVFPRKWSPDGNWAEAPSRNDAPGEDTGNGSEGQ